MSFQLDQLSYPVHEVNPKTGSGKGRASQETWTLISFICKGADWEIWQWFGAETRRGHKSTAIQDLCMGHPSPLCILETHGEELPNLSESKPAFSIDSSLDNSVQETIQDVTPTSFPPTCISTGEEIWGSGFYVSAFFSSPWKKTLSEVLHWNRMTGKRHCFPGNVKDTRLGATFVPKLFTSK